MTVSAGNAKGRRQQAPLFSSKRRVAARVCRLQTELWPTDKGAGGEAAFKLHWSVDAHILVATCHNDGENR